jgi:hypothetical protein
MSALCSDDAQLRYVPLGKFGEGAVRTVGRRMWSALIAALPDLTVTVLWSVADARGASAEALIADDRRGFQLPHAFLLRFDPSGRIAEIVAYWDNVNFAVQSAKAAFSSLLSAGEALRKRPI